MKSDALSLLQLERPLIIGHRGYCARAPENTLPSFKLALGAGADLVELDYHHSQDGVPMVIHDETLDRTTPAPKVWRQARIKVAQRTAAELQTLDAGSWFDAKYAGAKIPLLKEALALIESGGGCALIEHKSGDAETCVQLLRELRLINRVVVISFDWSFLREFHRLEPSQVLGALGPPTRLADGRRPVRLWRTLTSARAGELLKLGVKVAVWNRSISRKAVWLAHQHQLKVWVYTVNQARLAAKLVDMGVDGLITNEVSLLQSALRSA